MSGTLVQPWLASHGRVKQHRIHILWLFVSAFTFWITVWSNQGNSKFSILVTCSYLFFLWLLPFLSFSCDSMSFSSSLLFLFLFLLTLSRNLELNCEEESGKLVVFLLLKDKLVVITKRTHTDNIILCLFKFSTFHKTNLEKHTLLYMASPPQRNMLLKRPRFISPKLW